MMEFAEAAGAKAKAAETANVNIEKRKVVECTPVPPGGYLESTS
jgi:hypothetical protein